VPAAKPVVLVEILIDEVEDTVPLVGVTPSHVPPEGLVTDAEAVKLIPLVPVTLTTLAVGCVPPIV
jgi:hypothetical protein